MCCPLKSPRESCQLAFATKKKILEVCPGGQPTGSAAGSVSALTFPPSLWLLVFPGKCSWQGRRWLGPGPGSGGDWIRAVREPAGARRGRGEEGGRVTERARRGRGRVSHAVEPRGLDSVTSCTRPGCFFTACEDFPALCRVS